MGGLRKAMPWTYATFLIASISLAGIWPFAGFWSKDEVLTVALQQAPVLFALAMITVFITAFYIFRVVYLTFHGEYKGGAKEDTRPRRWRGAHHTARITGGDAHSHGGSGSAGGMPPACGISTADSVPSIGEGTTHSLYQDFSVYWPAPSWISMAVAGAGFLLAYAIYSKKWISSENVARAFGPTYKLGL